VMRPEDGDQFRCQRNRLFPPLLDGAAAPGRRPDGSGTPSHVAGNPSGTGADHRPVCTDAAALTACSPSGNPLGKATGACPLCMQWDHRIRAATGAAEADTKYELPPGIPRRSAGSARRLVRSSTPEAWPGSRTPGTARPGTPTAGPEPLPAAARTTARSTSGRCCACGVPHPAQPVPRRPGASPFHPRLSTVDLPMRQDCGRLSRVSQPPYTHWTRSRVPSAHDSVPCPPPPFLHRALPRAPADNDPADACRCWGISNYGVDQ
jgi:hypothetical protein